MNDDVCFCGKPKKGDRLACPRCFEVYRDETRRQKVPFIVWVEVKALKKLDVLGASQKDPQTNLERDLAKIRKELQALKNRITQEAPTVLQERLTGAGHLSQDEMAATKKDVEDELWDEGGGNRLFAQMKSLQREIMEQVAPIRRVLQQIEKTKSENSSVDQVVSSIFSKQKQ